MSGNTPQQAQGSQGQQSGPPLLKPEDLNKLLCLSDDQKQKYRQSLNTFWVMLQNKAPGSPEHATARSKLLEWSTKLIQQERAWRVKNKGQAGQDSLGQSAQQNQQPQQQQNAPSVQPKPEPSSQPAQPTQQQQQQQGNRAQGAPQQNRPINPNIIKHVENFPFVLPPGGPAPGSPEANEKVQNMKNTLTQCLVRQEHSSNIKSSLEQQIQQRRNSGQDVAQELLAQRQTALQTYESAKRWLDEFKSKQLEWKKNGGLPAGGQAAQQQQQQPTQGQQGQGPAQPQTQPLAQSQGQNQKPQQPMVKQEPQIKVEGGQQFNHMQGGPQQQNQQGMPPGNQQQHRPPPAPHSQVPQQQMPQQNHGFAQPGQQHQPPRPQINPQQANAHMQHQNNSPHPQSATSNPAGPPVPLSHQAAVSAAQRSYSNSDAQRTATPMQAGPGNFPNAGNREREQLNNPKMPIPRQLNVQQPVPVHMGQARPTMSGPTNSAPGPMGQPVMSKFPTFQLEGEGDRVLSKRKLDELVRQVTGGSEDALTPEVEEAMLQLADEFVDTVITSACKLAKLRESPNLEIRDLQVVLERNYNVRIPGYASDEVRTVRKLVPAPGWTQKMNAVQAAKVMGGKTDI